MSIIFNLTITMNDTTMQTEADVRNALLCNLSTDDYYLELTDGVITDYEGTQVGSWTVAPEADEEAVRHALGAYGDWQYEVSNGDTRLGFEDWQEHKFESEGTSAPAPIDSHMWAHPWTETP